ncbi:acyl carrier protein [Oleidesulfovibrio sp.]|uniref:acyl carrier protein n=1 Tax=Oleidesulfovibrio sp. TaxID=2909707 RepID=UPI003A8B088B
MTQPLPETAITETVCRIIAEVLDISPDEIFSDTYVIRDLETESIDLLEYGVGLNAAFGIPVRDETVFLKSLRVHIEEAKQHNAPVQGYLATRYPHLAPERIDEILQTVTDGPVLRVQDIVEYVRHAQKSAEAGCHDC